MSIGVVYGSEYHLNLLDKGYVETKKDKFIDSDGYRVWLADPETTCLEKMRDGLCLLDKGHRGRHSTVVFYCDGCSKARRSYPASQDNVSGVAFCFLCMKEAKRRGY